MTPHELTGANVQFLGLESGSSDKRLRFSLSKKRDAGAGGASESTQDPQFAASAAKTFVECEVLQALHAHSTPHLRIDHLCLCLCDAESAGRRTNSRPPRRCQIRRARSAAVRFSDRQ